MSLRSFQESFLAALRDGENDGVVSQLATTGNLAPEAGLAIYRHNHEASLQKALRNLYPLCDILLGAEFMDQARGDFVGGHPSRTPDLNFYGAEMSDYLRALSSLKDLGYVADMARLEWLWHCAEHGAAEDPQRIRSELERALASDPQDAYFRLPASAGLLFSKWPLLDIRRYCLEEGEDLQIGKGVTYLIVLRTSAEVRAEPVEAHLWPLLCAMEQKVSLLHLNNEILPGMGCTTEKQILAVIQTLLHHGWIGAGVF